MKLFGLRNLIGLAAIGGAVAYARKHGGFKNAFNELMSKKDQLLSKAQQGQQGQQGQSSMGSSYTGSVGSSVGGESIGSTTGSGLGGSGGGNGYGGR